MGGRTKYADYTYLGAGTVVMVKVAYPAVPAPLGTGGLALTYAGAASGDYSGFDPTSRPGRYARASRFGRVVWQRWLRTDGSAVDRYFYGYDPPSPVGLRRASRAGNRKWRAERADLSNAGGRDEAYVYDPSSPHRLRRAGKLDRLIGAKRGILPSGTYQAPYPGDVDLNGHVNVTDSSIQDDNWLQSGKAWTQGDLNGDGTVDGTDSTIIGDNWLANPNESVVKQWSWTLDPVGNWSGYKASGATTQPWDLDQTRLHNKANEIEDTVNQTPNAISGTPDWVDPAYDLAGNMTSGPQPRYETVDANTQWYKYDAWNRLTRLGQGASSPGTTVATYSYDGQNRRIRKVVAGDDTYDYYYNESWQVLEVQKAGRTNKTYQQSVWGIQYVDAPVVRFQDSDTNGTLNNTLYYTYDAQFNVTALIEPDGDVVERYVYDPYGQVTIYDGTWSSTRASSSFDNCIMYCGYRFDPESGNYIARRRYLTPPLGRWLTPDPIGYAPNTHFTLLPCPQGRCNFPGKSTPCASSVTLRRPKLPTQYADGMNVYLYVQSNPVNKVDPHGLITVECCYDMLGKALANPTVGAAYDKANAARDGLGIPCLHIVKCVKSSIGNPSGAYNPFTRDVLMCADNLSTNQNLFNQILLHELIHAESICGWWKLGCKNCMIEEKRAYFLSGECATDESCTNSAWDSCIISLSCSDQGDSKNNYLGVGWRPAP